MIRHGFRRLSFLLLFTVWCWSVQRLAAQEINYNMVPNLQQMNQSSPLPDFALPDPAGKKTALKDFRGKLVMLNFWASWCVPCREEMSAVERLYQEFQNKGFVILGVNVRDKREDAVAVIKELNLTYPVVFDPTGRWVLAYGAWGLPNTYLIGPKGEGLARMQGHADWYSPGARALIQALLNQKNQ